MKSIKMLDGVAIKTRLLIAVTIVFLTSYAAAQSPTVAVMKTGNALVKSDLTFQYLFFFKEDDTATHSLLEMTRQEVDKMGDTVSMAEVAIKDPVHAELVQRYGVSRAPMPLVLCVADNGAVTKSLVAPFTAAQLQEGLVSRGSAESLKALQDRKLVVLCAFNGSTPVNDAVYQNANKLKTDSRFAGAVEVVKVDVNDQSEVDLLKQFQLTSEMSDPTTIILAPPGNQLARFVGLINTEQLAEKVVVAQNTCCPGGKCGPDSQCCPGGNCPPQKK